MQSGPDDLAEVAELGEDWFDRAVEPKQAVDPRLSPRVLERFRAGGPGWRTRIIAASEDWLKNDP